MHKFATRPLYLLVRDALVQRICAGEWRPGTAIPNEFELARQMGVSVGTMRKALDELEKERVVDRKQGRGTFVTDHSTGELAIRFSSIRDPMGNPIHGLVREAAWSRGVATPDEVKRMGLHRAAEVVRVTRVRTYHNHAFAWDASVLPASLFPHFPSDLGSYRINALAQSNGLILKHAVGMVRADLAGSEDVSRLGVTLGSPVLVLDRDVVCDDGRIAEWRVARCHLQEKKYVVVSS